jgi:hypothetical protein
MLQQIQKLFTAASKQNKRPMPVSAQGVIFFMMMLTG